MKCPIKRIRYKKARELDISALGTRCGGVRMLFSTMYKSPVGMITLACDESNLVGLWLQGQKYFGSTVSDIIAANDDIPVFTAVKNWLDRYFAGEAPTISEIPLRPTGGEFRQGVWRVLCGIPYGKIITYGDIAKQIAVKMNRASMSSQAVGGAVGHNPISIIIPCHRVVGSNGSLTGYAGGIGTKAKLLKLEGVDMSQLFMPEKGTSL